MAPGAARAKGPRADARPVDDRRATRAAVSGPNAHAKREAFGTDSRSSLLANFRNCQYGAPEIISGGVTCLSSRVLELHVFTPILNNLRVSR